MTTKRVVRIDVEMDPRCDVNPTHLATSVQVHLRRVGYPFLDQAETHLVYDSAQDPNHESYRA